MAKIITQQIYQGQSKKARGDLNSILTEWSFNKKPITSAHEFLTRMKPWINARIKDQEELEKFLKKKGVNSLKEIK